MTSRFPIVLLAVLALAVSSLVSAEETEKKEAKKAVAKPKGKVGRPSKAAPKVTAPKKRGRPTRRTSAKKSGVSTQLSGVARDLGFASVDEMVKTILRKHKIGKLDL